jgi:hypothetical protein
MKKLSEGHIDCLIRGLQKGHIWTYGNCWAGKSFQKNERYVSKLKLMGLIENKNDTPNNTFANEFYYLTDEGKKVINDILKK